MTGKDCACDISAIVDGLGSHNDAPGLEAAALAAIQWLESLDQGAKRGRGKGVAKTRDDRDFSLISKLVKASQLALTSADASFDVGTLAKLAGSVALLLPMIRRVHAVFCHIFLFI